MKICPACSREYTEEHLNCRDDGAALVHLDTGVSGRPQNLIGQIVDGRYRIERIVGRGGMGTVYACRHVVVGKAFAMKVLRPGIERSEEVLQRFIREAQAANAVQSRHICEMTDFGQLPSGAFYVVMELLQGASLTRALREGRLGRKELKHVFIQIAETLDKAHGAGIIHRDMKPDNVVLVEDEGDPLFAKLVDFGIAKVIQTEASNLTETGVILGTPYYMSPEQARGEELDHRSDIYALGVMMYRAFTGRLPFVADTAMGVLTRHLTEKPEMPSRVAEIDPALERLILRCLEKKPIDRFQSMADTAEAIRAVPDEPRATQQHPTIDERSGALPLTHHVVAPPSVAPQSLPTRVTSNNPASIPPPLPPPASPQGNPAAAFGEASPHAASAGASGPYAAAPMSGAPSPQLGPLAAGQPPGAAPYNVDYLQNEAHTHRGVVSSRISAWPGRAGSRRKALIGGLAVAALCVGVVAAIFVLADGSGAPAPAASTAPTVSAATTETDDEALAETGSTQSGDAEETSSAPSASASSSSKAATSAAPKTRPPSTWRPPPPPPPEPTVTKQPGDDIRSPFD